jgi:glycosyltransferase involved in cell wall biosynthesis
LAGQSSKTKKRVVIVGSFPPPYGGIGVHIRRASDLLSEFYDIRVVDLYGRRQPTDSPKIIRCGTVTPFNLVAACFWLRFIKPDIAHFHVSATDRFAYVGSMLLQALPRRSKRIITIHSGRFVSAYANGNWLRRKVLRLLLQNFDHIIAVNHDQQALLHQIGCKPESVSVLPAFLPPSPAASSFVDELVREISKAGKRILVTSGYGQMHYGYHHIVEASKALGPDTKKIHFVLCLYNTYDEEYLGRVERELRQLVDTTICRDLTPDEFSYLLSKSDVYIRATDRDGDAVAIREAVYFGRKIIASDVVTRPPGCILFTIGDPIALAQAIRICLSDNQSGLVTSDNARAAEQLLALYSSMEVSE